MMDEVARTIGTAVQQYVEKHLMPILNKLENASDNLQNATQTAREVTGEVNKAVEKATACEENEAYNAAATRETYAAALKGNVPLLHPRNLAKVNARNCQILIDKDTHVEQNNLDTLTEQEHVAKANEAMEQLGVTLDIKNYIFMGVKKLANGGVVFDMNTPNAVKWVHLHKRTFTEKFGSTAIIKEHTVSVIIEYVPTSYTPDALTEHRKIEQDSKLPSNTLAATRWIKPIHTVAQKTVSMFPDLNIIAL